MGDRRYVLNGLNSIVEVDTTATDQSEATEEILKEEEITKYQCREHMACTFGQTMQVASSIGI